MRLSSDKASPYYRSDLGFWSVFLNGKLVKLCTEASEEWGVVWLIETDEKGHAVLEGEGDNRRLKIRQHYGKVEIRKKI